MGFFEGFKRRRGVNLFRKKKNAFTDFVTVFNFKASVKKKTILLRGHGLYEIQTLGFIYNLERKRKQPSTFSLVCSFLLGPLKLPGL